MSRRRSLLATLKNTSEQFNYFDYDAGGLMPGSLNTTGTSVNFSYVSGRFSTWMAQPITSNEVYTLQIAEGYAFYRVSFLYWDPDEEMYLQLSTTYFNPVIQSTEITTPEGAEAYKVVVVTNPLIAPSNDEIWQQVMTESNIRIYKKE